MTTEDSFHGLVNVDYPMYIVTAASHGTRAGCLVGFATQASIDPSRLIVMLSKENHTYRVSQDAGELVVHFLHQDNYRLAELFGGETGDEMDKFAQCECQETAGGTPILRGTRGWVVGPILARLDAGDHVAHLVDVDQAATDVPGAMLSFQAAQDLEPGHPA